MWITSGSLVQTCQWLPHSSSCMSDVHGNMDRWTRSQASAHTHLTPSMCRGNQQEKGRGRGILQSLNIVLSCHGECSVRGYDRQSMRWRFRHWQQPEEKENKTGQEITWSTRYSTRSTWKPLWCWGNEIVCDVMVGNDWDHDVAC